MEGDQGSEQARDEKDVRDVGEQRAAFGEPHEHQVRPEFLRGGHDVRGPDTHGEGPGRKHVEHGNHGHCDVGRAGHGLPGILGFLGVNGARFEPHECRDSKSQEHPDSGGEEVLRIKGLEPDSLRGGHERQDGDHTHHEKFEGDQNTEHLGGEVHAVDAQDTNDHPSGQRGEPPGNRDAGQAGEQGGQ